MTTTATHAAPPQDPTAQHPLALGQTLLPALDGTVIFTPHGASHARYQRAVVSSTSLAGEDDLDLGPLDGIRSVQAVDDPSTGRQRIVVLTDAGLEVIACADGATGRTHHAVDTSGITVVVDADPTAPDRIVLAGTSGGAAALWVFDLGSGTLGDPLPVGAVAGDITGGRFLRQGLGAELVVVADHAGALTAARIDGALLDGTGCTGSATVQSVSVGAMSGGDQPQLARGRLLAKNADQQLVVTFPTSATACELALVGLDDDRAPTVLDHATPDLAFAAPERPVFRVGCGDVLVAGQDQIVIGYAATYKAVKGCAALLLYEVSDAGRLTFLSQYAASNAGGQPLASIDLHLAVGEFGVGQALGVLVLGAGATIQQLFDGKASVLGGLVTVDRANRTFPPLGTSPGVPERLAALDTIDADTDAFFGLPSDVTGQSVVLGPPTLEERQGKQQILALIQAPPFESSVKTSPPSLTFTQSDDKVKGYNVSTNKQWTFSDDAGVSLGIGPVQLGQTMNKTYGHGFDHVKDSTSTTLVQVTTTITDNDMMVLYGMSYDVWSYPVLQASKQSGPAGHLLVVVPKTPSPVQTMITANTKDFGYTPRSEVGSLITYQDVPRDGYQLQNQLFDLISAPVTQDGGGTTVTYDQTNMNSDTVGKDFIVHNSLNDSAHFNVSKTFFDYIPTSFGLNVGDSKSYAKTKVETTSLTRSKSLGITLSSGSVQDIEFEYQITPYIYQHETMGCLVVAYDIALTGVGWAKHYGTPRMHLVRPDPDSEDKLLACFTRMITFEDRDDGQVDIRVEVLNASLTTATSIECEVYLGQPDTSTSPPKPPSQLLGKLSHPTLGPAERTGLVLTTGLDPQSQVTVVVWSDDLSPLADVGWSVYPASDFAGESS